MVMLAKERRALLIAALDARKRADAYQQGIDKAEIDFPNDPNWALFLKGAMIAMNGFADAIDELLEDPNQWKESVRIFNESTETVPESVDPGARLWQ